MGRAVVLTSENLENADLTLLPPGSSVSLLDHFDVEACVECWERFRRLSDDLRWLARPEHFSKTVTITEIPSSYGRRALRDVLERYAHVTVNPTDIVFQFDKRGKQKDVAWVVCHSERDANRVLEKIQELPVPQRVQYAGLFGSAFLWSRRSSLFITHPKLDFELHRNRSQVFTCGWDSATEADDVQDILIDQKLCPSSILKVENGTTGDVGFLLEYPTMAEARSAMVRLDRFKHQWKLPQHQVIYAFPRQANVKWADEKGFYSTEEESDSDIDDPIDY